VAKEVVRPGTPAWRELVATFGEDILLPDGSIDRRRLGDRVFGDPAAVRRLNEITHPRIVAAIKDRLRALAAGEHGEPPPGVVIDAPLLIEAGMVDMVDEVWVVVVDAETQIRRLIARDNFDEKQARHRIEAQMPLEQKLAYADEVIDNRGPVGETKAQVRRLWERVVRRTRSGGIGSGSVR